MRALFYWLTGAHDADPADCTLRSAEAARQGNDVERGEPVENRSAPRLDAAVVGVGATHRVAQVAAQCATLFVRKAPPRTVAVAGLPIAAQRAAQFDALQFACRRCLRGAHALVGPRRTRRTDSNTDDHGARQQDAPRTWRDRRLERAITAISEFHRVVFRAQVGFLRELSTSSKIRQLQNEEQRQTAHRTWLCKAMLPLVPALTKRYRVRLGRLPATLASAERAG